MCFPTMLQISFFANQIISLKLSKTQNFRKIRQFLNRKVINGLKKFLEPSNKTSVEQPDTTDMPELESEESKAERRNQQGQGLKVLTQDQMVSRLPITVAQLKAVNYSQKLVNEIRQLLYSFYRSKKLTKTICNHLINAI